MNGEPLEGIGLAQVPESFTAKDLSEYVYKATGITSRLCFYVQSVAFTGTLGYMARSHGYDLEATVDLESFTLIDNLEPNCITELPSQVTCFRFCSSRKELFVATLDKRLFLYKVEKSFNLLYEKEVGHVITQLSIYQGRVFGTSLENGVFEVLEKGVKMIHQEDSGRITFFTADAGFVIGLSNGLVKTFTQDISRLSSPIVFIHSMQEKRAFFAISESGDIVEYNFDTKKTRAASLNTEITSCCAHNNEVYAGSTHGKVFVIDEEMNYRTFSITLGYIDWIFVNRDFLAASNSEELVIYEKAGGKPISSTYHGGQVVFIDGNKELLITGFGNFIYKFILKNLK